MSQPDVELTIRGDVRALKLNHGDKVIIEFPHHRVSGQAMQQAREQLQKLFPLNEVVVIGGGRALVLPAGSDQARQL